MNTATLEKPKLSINVINNYDPTRTTYLRNLFARDMTKRFNKLCGIIRKAIIDEDCFGLQSNLITFAEMTTPGRKAFEFTRSGDKVNAFMEWLKQQEEAGILETTKRPQIGRGIEDAWTNFYIKDSYQRGVIRARYEMTGAGYDVPGLDDSGGIGVVMMQPPHVDRLGLLYTRTFNDLKGITDAMDLQISRILAQAMADGENPRKIAKLLTKTITDPFGDLSITDTLGRFIPARRRAQMLARTEVIRSHHQGMIQEYKNWGLEGVRVKAEWRTTDDGRVCDECSSMDGEVFTIKEIESMIPAHPNCRCIALPVDITDENND